MHMSSNYLCSCANHSGVFEVTCLHSPAPPVFGMGLSQSDNTSTANTSNSCWTLIFWRSQLEVNTFEHETHQPERKRQLPTHTQWQVLGLLISRSIDNKECLLIAQGRRTLLEMIGDKEGWDFLLEKQTGGEIPGRNFSERQSKCTFPACDLNVVNKTGVQCPALIVSVAPFETLGKLFNLSLSRFSQLQKPKKLLLNLEKSLSTYESKQNVNSTLSSALLHHFQFL